MKMTHFIVTVITLFTLAGIAGCKNKSEAVPEIGELKSPTEMKPVLMNLKVYLEQSPDIQEEIGRIIDWHNASTDRDLKGESLEVLYGFISDQEGKVSFARSSLRVFIRLDSKEVIREALLHKNLDVVGIASEAITQNASEGEPDKDAIPYLSTVLKENNFIQEGDEEATVHFLVKKSLVEALQQTAGLEMEEIDVNNAMEIEKLLQRVSP